MMPPLNLDAVAQAHVARMVALLTVGTAVAAAGALALRFGSRLSAAARYAIALSLFVLLAFVAIRPEGTLAAESHAAVVPSLYVSPQWARWIFGAWAIIAAAGLLRIIFGIRRVRRLKRKSAAVSLEALPPAVRQSLEGASRFGRAVQLISSESVKVPAAVGFFRPAVVLPSWMINSGDISPDDLHALVLHELAHLHRYDDWVNLAQKIAKALLFFHPAVWWLDHRIGAEREMACDDAVLQSATDPQLYARCLVRMAEHSYVRRTLALAQAAVGHVRLTSLRVKRLLADAEKRALGKRPIAVLSALGCIAMAATLGPQPQLITFAKSYSAGAAQSASKSLPRTSGVILAASKSETTNVFTPAKLRVEQPAPKPAKAKHKMAPPGVLRAATHNQPTRPDSYWLVIETSQQFVGPGLTQVETWRVVVLTSKPPAHRAIPNKEI